MSQKNTNKEFNFKLQNTCEQVKISNFDKSIS